MFLLFALITEGFPGGSAGKESACNAGDLGSIPGLGRSPGEEKGYPNPWVGKIPLEKGKATHFSILAWRIPWRQFMGLQRIGHN